MPSRNIVVRSTRNIILTLPPLLCTWVGTRHCTNVNCEWLHVYLLGSWCGSVVCRAPPDLLGSRKPIYLAPSYHTYYIQRFICLYKLILVYLPTLHQSTNNVTFISKQCIQNKALFLGATYFLQWLISKYIFLVISMNQYFNWPFCKNYGIMIRYWIIFTSNRMQLEQILKQWVYSL